MRSTIWQVFTLNILWFALTVSGNALDPIIVPLMVQGFVPEDIKATALAGLTTAGLVVALVWQPIVGALSDRGRQGRLPFLLIGAAAFVVGLPLMAFAPSLVILLAAILLLQLASNTVQGPLQALASDYLPSTLWGRAAGLKAVFEVAGIVIGAYAAGQLVAANKVLGAYTLVAGVFIVAALLTVAGLRGARRLIQSVEAAPETEGGADFSSLKTVLSPTLRPFLWWLVNRYFFIVGLTTIRVFFFYFAQDYLRLPEPAAVVGNLVAAIGVVVLFVALPAGALADRIGRRRLMLSASVLATLAAPLFLLARTPTQLLLVGALIGIAAAIFQSVGWAMAMDLVPPTQVGRYLGLSNIATAGGSLSARLVGPLIDVLNAQQFGLGYMAMFLLNTLCFAITGLALLRIRPQTTSLTPGPTETATA